MAAAAGRYAGMPRVQGGPAWPACPSARRGGRDGWALRFWSRRKQETRARATVPRCASWHASGVHTVRRWCVALRGLTRAPRCMVL